MKKLLFFVFLILSQLALAEDVCILLNGASIIAQDNKNTMLGKIVNSYNSESIFNDYGVYGNEYNGGSIWNQFSTFGNEFNSYSPFNSYSTNPPMLIKQGKIIGYLSANKSIKNSISPNLLKALCKDAL